MLRSWRAFSRAANYPSHAFPSRWLRGNPGKQQQLHGAASLVRASSPLPLSHHPFLAPLLASLAASSRSAHPRASLLSVSRSFSSLSSSALAPSAQLLPLLHQAGANAGTRIAEALRNYYTLSKFRLSLLVVSTATAGFVMGSGERVEWAKCAWVSLGTFLASASANSFNQIFEAANDAAMKRTMMRPLPSGRMSRPHALTFACATGISGVSLLLATQDSLVPAALAAGNVGLYALVYTSLKRLHICNTWVGAVVGAVPPLIGWAAASHGDLCASGAWLWAGVLYYWQLPHFLSLAWLCRNDYASAGYKMMSVVDKTGHRTAAAALRNCVYLLPLGVAFYHLGVTSAPFAAESVLLTCAMAASALPFYRTPSSATARALFRTSLLYLPLYMGAMLLHRTPQHHSTPLPTLLPFPHQRAQLAHLHQGATGEGEDTAKEEDSKLKGALVRSVSPGRSSVRNHDPLRHQEGTELEQHKLGLERRPRPLPPAAFLSAAPFPFLPLPQ